MNNPGQEKISVLMMVENLENKLNLKGSPVTIKELLSKQDGVGELLVELPERLQHANIPDINDVHEIWNHVRYYLHLNNRFQEALTVCMAWYDYLLNYQLSEGRTHKGTPLVLISDYYQKLNHRAHALRYKMLTLCEDAISHRGIIDPKKGGIYYRLVWFQGLSDGFVREYASEAFKLSENFPDEAAHPEAMLQRLNGDWQNELPSNDELLHYKVNRFYTKLLLEQLGDSHGNALEMLAQYLMSCIPGCRVQRHIRSVSTDYDLICSIDGEGHDFRTEFGRYFICECKDWQEPANFTAFAKFCRVLDSVKSRFGILFSKKGITGCANTTDAAREQLKIYQDRGIIIVVITLSDIQEVSSGSSLIQILRNKYETIRLDLRK